MSNLNLQKLREWVWPWPWTFKLVSITRCYCCLLGHQNCKTGFMTMMIVQNSVCLVRIFCKHLIYQSLKLFPLLFCWT